MDTIRGPHHQSSGASSQDNTGYNLGKKDNETQTLSLYVTLNNSSLEKIPKKNQESNPGPLD